MLFTTLAMAAMVGVSKAIDVQVVYVGHNPVNNVTANKYWPEKITAAPGSMVQFQFWAGNHTITQSNFDEPCVPITQTANGTTVTAVKSGFMPTEESRDLGQMPIYSVLINDTQPLWFYCGQGPHCAGGMSMVINENTASGKTLETYKTAASGTGEGTAPPTGGDETAPPSGGDETVPPSGGDETVAPPASETPGSGDVPGSIPGGADEIGDDEVPTAGASLISLSWTALLAAAVMFAL